MEITKENHLIHGKLSACSAQFLDFVKENPDTLQRSNFSALLSDERYTYFKSQPWPTFINEKRKQEMEEAARKVGNLIRSIPGRFFDYDPHRVSRYYEIPENVIRMLFHGVGEDYINNLLGRGDFIFSPTSGLKCLEFNMQATLGGWELDLLEPLYIDTPIIAEFFNKYRVRLNKNHFFPLLLDHLIDRALNHFGNAPGFENEINMAIVLLDDIEVGEGDVEKRLKELYKKSLRRKNNALKGELMFCYNRRLKVIDHNVTVRDKKVHIYLERCNCLVPPDVMEVLNAGNVLLYNGPLGVLLTDKLNLALLSEHEDSDIFNSEEREAIKKYIPWTRKITAAETTYGTEKIKLDDFMIANRDRLVIKPSAGFGGRDVLVGFNTSPDQWKRQVEKAIRGKKWLVQEYVPSFSYVYQAGEQGCALFHAVWGLFVFGSRYAGGFVRIMPETGTTGVINTKLGAEESIILEVREQE